MDKNRLKKVQQSSMSLQKSLVHKGFFSMEELSDEFLYKFVNYQFLLHSG